MAGSLRAFRVDQRGDREAASNGRSRFEAYLQMGGHFYGIDQDDRHSFAIASILTALPPVMSPGYVLTDKRVRDVRPHWDDDNRLAFEVTLVSALPVEVSRQADFRWRSWQRERQMFGGDTLWSDPYDNDRPALLPTLAVRVPIAVELLPTPEFVRGVPVTAVAKQAVRVVCGELSRCLEPVLAGLDAAGVSA
ncbi:hypothetical protein [Saccharothrix sp.]|uniref:hypothetical protein n=1 Tax=Saccharothrix sp. TaxID=1873460 RepID=UPI0028115E0B|nr:hypothetical protein [Saccharothrix sp.]